MLPPSPHFVVQGKEKQFGPGTVGIFAQFPAPPVQPLIEVVFDPQVAAFPAVSRPSRLNSSITGTEYWSYPGGQRILPTGLLWVVWTKHDPLSGSIRPQSYDESRGVHRFTHGGGVITPDSVQRASGSTGLDGLQIALKDGGGEWRNAAWVVRELGVERNPPGTGIEDFVVKAEHWVVNFRWVFEDQQPTEIRVTGWAGDLGQLMRILPRGSNDAYYHAGPGRPPSDLDGGDEG